MTWRRLSALGDAGPRMAGRHKRKDAYDIHYCERNYPGGIELLAQEYFLMPQGTSINLLQFGFSPVHLRKFPNPAPSAIATSSGPKPASSFADPG